MAETQPTHKRSGGFSVRRLILPGIFVAALFVVTVLRDRPENQAGSSVWSFSGPTMGTTFVVKIAAPDLDARELADIQSAIRESVDAVDRSMSTYKPESELSRFNRSGDQPFVLSDDFLEVMAVAEDVGRRSGGAFDVTVGPLVDAWGFGPGEWNGIPDDGLIESLMSSTGWDHLALDADSGTLRKTEPSVRIDLSAIAKGFAVDRVWRTLHDRGYTDLMIEIGGEIRAGGLNEQGHPWRIGIERPDETGREVQVTLLLRDLALATSGDYRNFRDLEHQRISHTIDPRTGRPVEHHLSSVSIVGRRCVEADAWATALTVLGPEEGRAVAEENGLDALFILRTPSGFETTTAGNFPIEDRP